ncbi:hypothetical protein LSH36_117g04005 [Paralvinella palmiformis]|uniref:Uncharacterized protein n=1 Tax=Paralvinella palmiformis TaxID=53620 RepID=A0AAD9N8W2_9ANNE|nr:hypothetical protein LSH36_117g04005 [Paralvinella palmiformis]
MENQVHLMNECPVDGCLVLGRKGPSYSMYNTRYYVNRKEQRQHASRTYLLDECLPCYKYENQSAVARALWSVLRSESFLFLMQTLVLSIGVSKECLDLRHRYPGVHFYQTVLETAITCLHICIRLMVVWMEFHAIKKPLAEVGYVEADSSVRGKYLYKYLLGYVVLGISTVLISWILFAIFHGTTHLGWTLLTNNLFIVANTATASLMKTRLALLYFEVREDDHKVALFETVLLLRESFLLRGDEERQDYLNRVERFLTAFKNTPYFIQPEHIHVLMEYVPDWNIYKSGEQITVV